jgi:hypothetical protein
VNLGRLLVLFFFKSGSFQIGRSPGTAPAKNIPALPHLRYCDVLPVPYTGTGLSSPAYRLHERGRLVSTGSFGVFYMVNELFDLDAEYALEVLGKLIQWTTCCSHDAVLPLVAYGLKDAGQWRVFPPRAPSTA